MVYVTCINTDWNTLFWTGLTTPAGTSHSSITTTAVSTTPDVSVERIKKNDPLFIDLLNSKKFQKSSKKVPKKFQKVPKSSKKFQKMLFNTVRMYSSPSISLSKVETVAENCSSDSKNRHCHEQRPRSVLTLVERKKFTVSNGEQTHQQQEQTQQQQSYRSGVSFVFVQYFVRSVFRSVFVQYFYQYYFGPL